MIFQGFLIGLQMGNTLGDIKCKRGEAVSIKIHFLIVWDLAKGAEIWSVAS